MLASLDTFASSQKPNFSMNKNFELKLLATNWGFPGTIDEYCAKVKQDDYDGIEIWSPLEKKDQDALFLALKNNNLEVGFLTAGHESKYEDHFKTFTNMVDTAARNTIQKP